MYRWLPGIIYSQECLVLFVRNFGKGNKEKKMWNILHFRTRMLITNRATTELVRRVQYFMNLSLPILALDFIHSFIHSVV